MWFYALKVHKIWNKYAHTRLRKPAVLRFKIHSWLLETAAEKNCCFSCSTAVSKVCKGTVHSQIKNTYFSSGLYCYLSMWIVLLWVAELWRYWPKTCLPSLDHNKSRWHLACGAQGTKKWKHVKYSKAMSLSRNHVLLTQHNPQTLRTTSQVPSTPILFENTDNSTADISTTWQFTPN